VNPLFEAAAEIQAFFVERGWQNTVIGGLAVQRWGEPRQTRDVDLALLTGVGHESAEDLVVLKAFADRPQDWIDVEGIIVRQRGGLDRALVRRELRDLLELKEDIGPETVLMKLFEKHPS
jgi:hypothetical protein